MPPALDTAHDIHRRQPFLLSAVAVTVAVCIGLYGWFLWCPSGRVVRGHGFEGISLQAATGDPGPGRDVIVVAEERLVTFLRSDSEIRAGRLAVETPLFRRYYSFTVGHDGTRYIRIDFLHREHVTRRLWLNRVIVSGGGDWFWEALYNPQSGSFSGVRHNGPM
jgi:hypothetical protein